MLNSDKSNFEIHLGPGTNLERRTRNIKFWSNDNWNNQNQLSYQAGLIAELLLNIVSIFIWSGGGCWCEAYGNRSGIASCYLNSCKNEVTTKDKKNHQRVETLDRGEKWNLGAHLFRLIKIMKKKMKRNDANTGQHYFHFIETGRLPCKDEKSEWAKSFIQFNANTLLCSQIIGHMIQSIKMMCAEFDKVKRTIEKLQIKYPIIPVSPS
jgi:hypothetical protein